MSAMDATTCPECEAIVGPLDEECRRCGAPLRPEPDAPAPARFTMERILPFIGIGLYLLILAPFVVGFAIWVLAE